MSESCFICKTNIPDVKTSDVFCGGVSIVCKACKSKMQRYYLSYKIKYVDFEYNDDSSCKTSDCDSDCFSNLHKLKDIIVNNVVLRIRDQYEYFNNSELETDGLYFTKLYLSENKIIFTIYVNEENDKNISKLEDLIKKTPVYQFDDDYTYTMKGKGFVILDI
jgi:hypothetical protein